MHSAIGFNLWFSLCGYLVALVFASTTAEQGLLGSIPGSGNVLLGFSISSSHEIRICARLMAIRSLPVTWELEHNWQTVSVLLGTPLSNP